MSNSSRADLPLCPGQGGHFGCNLIVKRLRKIKFLNLGFVSESTIMQHIDLSSGVIGVF